MTWLRRTFALPLLVKELTESSARWRTYGARLLFAAGLYGLLALFLPRIFWNFEDGSDSNVFALLGAGREMFEELAAVQTVGIALFLPAMMCGCITQEKERDSLVLLLLTELRPWQILLQKYLGGLVPVLSFILLGAPLMAVAYSLGGVAPEKLVEQSIGIVLLVFQLGALTLLCSVWCRTTVAALLGSYFLGALLYVAPPFLVLGVFGRSGSIEERLAFLFAPPVLFEITTGDRLSDRALTLLPTVLSIFLFLGLARFFFLRRISTPPSQFLRRVFRRLDAFMQRANRLTGGVILLREGSSLPGDAPIFWRETRTRALGRPHYLLRLLVLAEALTVLPCLFFALGSEDNFGILLAVVGALALLVVVVQSANVIVSERVNQTLEVLLTTPLTAAQIIREKERAFGRLLLVLASPLLTIFAVEYYLRYDSANFRAHLGPSFIAASVLAVLIYLPMFAWLAMTIGLWLRTRFRAIIVTLIVAVTWCVLPLIIADQIDRGPMIRTSMIPLPEPVRAEVFCKLLSPLGMIFISHAGGTWSEAGYLFPWPLVLGNFAAYGALALGLRTVLFSCADRWLRRP